MVILIVGSSGFLGNRLACALRAGGHMVRTTSRQQNAGDDQIRLDFSVPAVHEQLVAQLKDVDVVVNAAGILRERGSQTFERIHWRGPEELFKASSAAGVSHIVQISALGARTGNSGYFRSKRRANESLEALDVRWTIIEPALIYGAGGRSARMFTLLASLPLLPLPRGGAQLVQPVHVDDVVEALFEVIVHTRHVREYVPLAGPQPLLTLAAFLGTLREAMELGRARILSVPASLANLGARLMQLHPRALLDPDTLSMLEAGNTGDPAPLHELLRRPPRPVSAFIAQEDAAHLRLTALLSWLLPLLRWSIALVWLWTAVVSLGLYPTASSYELLAQVGATGVIATLLLYGAALLDLMLGVATLVLRRRRWLWAVQCAVILTFTLTISIALPQYWLHPFAPIAKNLPMLAAILLLWLLEEDS